MNPVAAIPSAAKTDQGGSPSPKLVKAARDFETILLSSWLEKLEASFSGPNDGSDPAHDTLASMGAQAIASSWAAHGGIGIGKLVLQHLTRQAGTAQPSTSPAEKKEFGATKVPPPIADRLQVKTP